MNQQKKSAKSSARKRCQWAVDPLNAVYHDQEWGDAVHDDRKLFEFITLEGAQAGLSWLTVLKRRENYRAAFANFDVQKISRFNQRDVARLMKNEGIIRHRLKIESVISNAKAFIKIQDQFKSFDRYIWSFVNHKPLVIRRKTLADIPAQSAQSDAMSKDLKKRGFKFVGSTICYAFMQACGLVSDHTDQCYKNRSTRKL